MRYGREVKALLDRQLRARLGEEQNIAGTLSIRTGAEPLHSSFQVNQVWSRITIQVVSDRHQLLTIEDLKGLRGLIGRRRLVTEDQVDGPFQLGNSSPLRLALSNAWSAG